MIEVGDQLPNRAIVFHIRLLGDLVEKGDDRCVQVFCILPKGVSGHKYASWSADRTRPDSTTGGHYYMTLEDMIKEENLAS